MVDSIPCRNPALGAWLGKNEIVIDGRLNEARLDTALSRQMGSPITLDCRGSSPLRRAVIGGLASHGAESQPLLRAAAAPGGVEWCRQVSEAITGEGLARLQAAVAAHAFELVVASALLRDARARHPLAPAEIRWVRHADPVLWWSLDCSPDARSHRLEVLGLRCHMAMEESLGRSIAVPHVSAASSVILRMASLSSGG